MLCNFQSVKCLYKYVEQNGGRKSWGHLVERQNSKKGFEKNEHACSMEGVFVVSDPSARQYLKVAGQTQKIQRLFKLRQVRK